MWRPTFDIAIPNYLANMTARSLTKQFIQVVSRQEIRERNEKIGYDCVKDWAPRSADWILQDLFLIRLWAPWNPGQLSAMRGLRGCTLRHCFSQRVTGCAPMHVTNIQSKVQMCIETDSEKFEHISNRGRWL
ncbi:hypothetical protein TNCV_64341 [Trichonephila clavipes]|nr:hypothetical protein TNCV_64341 [Trichonephila clavipes]